MAACRSIILVMCLALAGCQPGQKGWFDGWGKKQGDSAMVADPSRMSQPPEDFWLSITVTGPQRETMSAYDALPRALRPARYVLEADRVLRAAVGPGAKDESFPAETRRLTSVEVTQLWRLVGEAGLLDADHPYLVGSAPVAKAIEKQTTNAEMPERDVRTMYVIMLHASDKRRTLVMEASPRGSQDSRQAARVVDWVANKAWMRPSMMAK
jgi:hypothetical protein